MPRVDPRLFEQLQTRLRLSRRQTYERIAQKVREKHLPRHLAAIVLASEAGINISRYADEMAEIRRAGTLTQPAPQPAERAGGRRPTGRVAKGARTSRKPGTSVFVVHGRNEKLRRSLFSFLRSVGLAPLEWQKAIAITGKPSPYVGEILERAFQKVSAVIVLLSAEDEARLQSQFIRSSDSSYEKEFTGQARPNVLFEAGMAFGHHPDRTVLVQVGEIRPFSDITGRHLVRLNNSTERRQELITKLEAAGCKIDRAGSDWMTEGDFGQ